MFLGEFANDHGPQPPQNRPRHIGILCPGLRGSDHAAQMMYPNPKPPFLGPSPRRVELAFIVLTLMGNDLRQFLLKSLRTGPIREERPPDHRIKHP